MRHLTQAASCAGLRRAPIVPWGQRHITSCVFGFFVRCQSLFTLFTHSLFTYHLRSIGWLPSLGEDFRLYRLLSLQACNYVCHYMGRQRAWRRFAARSTGLAFLLHLPFPRQLFAMKKNVKERGKERGEGGGEEERGKEGKGENKAHNR